MKNAVVRARVDQELKSEAEAVLSSLGLNMSDAINALLSQIKLRKGLPFDISIPNRKTKKTFRDTDKGKNVVRYNDANEMFDDLDI